MRIVLGRLTHIAWRGGERAWTNVARAPWLVYDERGRLAIVYRASAIRGATEAETREYARTHWGERGEREAFAGEVARPPWRVLGVGTSITYTTRKGGDGAELVDYEHPWGDGARGAWRAPGVVEHACSDARCRAKGLLALRGGTYRVDTRGIVG